MKLKNNAMMEISEKRRHARSSQELTANLRVGKWPQRRHFRAKIQNLSANGFCVEIEPTSIHLSSEPVLISWLVPPSLAGSTTAIPATMSGVFVHNGVPHTYGIRLDRLLDEQIRHNQVRWRKILAAGGTALLAILIGILKVRNVVSFWYSPLIQIYSLITAAYILSRIALSMAYKEPEDRGVLKKVSIIVSVKNEEGHIADTIRRCFQSNYPADLLEVLVIDDGSTDRTWTVLSQLEAESPSLRIFRFKRNKGKRHAMAVGVQEAKGEIVVFMDSDVQVDPEGLYRIVQPFGDPTVGAVAGHTQVIIEPQNFISKMESVRYFVSQRIMKAAEGVFGTVTCCPGPFSAYRREAVLKVLRPWLEQTFLGSAATFGDDRSLTNYILRNYRVLYHFGARCGTYVPDRWPTFFRQQLRWKKSWVRETTIASRFMFRENAFAAISYYVGVIVTLVSPLVVLRAFIYSPLFLSSHAYLPYLAGLFLVFLLLGLIYYYHTQSRYWYYGLVFAVVYSWFFSLQTYYALLTVRKNHWGTR